jgi:hypothetical protein
MQTPVIQAFFEGIKGHLFDYEEIRQVFNVPGGSETCGQRILME